MDEEAGPTRAREISRRGFLLSVTAAGAAATGVGVLAARAGVPVPSPQPVLRNAQQATGEPGAGRGGVLHVEKVYSGARRRKVDLVTVFPDGGPVRGMPMCLLLHGLRSNARQITGGLNSILAGVVTRDGVPPFGFVAVDGGDSYWHANTPGDDPMGMLLDEVPHWLANRGLGGPNGTPFAVSGFSMGGFGAFLYARRRLERRDPVRAIGTISPALITSWSEMAKRGAFHDISDWASMDPLRNIGKHGDAPIGLWVGDHDQFVEGGRRFINAAHPQVGSITAGGHTASFLHKVMPDVTRFVGRYTPGAKPTTTGFVAGFPR